MNQAGFLQDLFASIAERGRRLLDFGGEGDGSADLAELAEALYSSLGEASGVAIADRMLRAYEARDPEGRVAFFRLLCDRFGIDADEAVAAAEAYREAPSPEALERLHLAAEPRRQELIRRLNLAPGGTAKLVRMREDVLAALRSHPDLRGLDMDFRHLFQSWFNRGFLEARRIDWQTPAAILDKIIRYEAVHEISDWEDLRRRIDPPDRRLYAFFHPRLADEPLIFVEVALTVDMPATIASILSPEREPTSPADARTAVFYSISNCQAGLRGVSFGNFLIKQVVEDLRRELPNLRTFVTLSPVPGFASWLAGERQRENGLVDAEAGDLLAALDAETWWQDEALLRRLEPVLTELAAYYLARARNGAGKPLDPVARFHLGNGARLERINFMGDRGRDGLRRAHGFLVNYLYKLEDIERNHESYANSGTVAASPPVTRLARSRNPMEAQTVTA
ncbi:malonyl-CoA decarboxylase [Faunimonas sp. B44]|uniref:malonyl-CoA decarboxylase n=1 Tax=Faunimonas sp. B44 TaxID=3461493 RepID=UPI004044F896